MKLRITVLIISVLSVVAIGLTTKKDSLGRILEMLEKYNHQNPQEKVYLHLAKNYYVPGGRIWYKVYLVNAASRVPQALSKVVNIELVSSSGEVVYAQKVRIEEGLGHGDLQIPKDVKEGGYLLRAYTNWMRNFNSDFYFTSPLLIAMPKADLQESEDEVVAADWQVDFMPEGGNLVLGIASKIAFKAIDQFGKGLEVNGDIIDENGKQITSFATFHDGMGAFVIKPEASASGQPLKYYALAKHAGSGRKIELPAVIPSGFAIAVDDRPERFVKVVVQSRGMEDGKQAFLLAQSHGYPYYTAQGVLKNGGFFISIPKDELPEGIVQLTLFDHNGLPQCERLVFVNQEADVSTDIIVDKNEFTTREKVQIKLKAQDANAKPAQGSVSISVVPDDKIQAPGFKPNIKSFLLLTSDLHGRINNPDFYLGRKDSPKAQRALDYLMMTHGWRRFTWQDVLEPKTQEKFFVEKFLTFKGTVIDTASGEPAADVDVLISVLGDHKIFSQTRTNEKGRFHFINSAYYGVEEVILRTAGEANRPGLRILLDDQTPTVTNSGFQSVINEPLRNFAVADVQRQKINHVYSSPEDEKEIAWLEDEAELNDELVSYPFTDAAVDLDDYIALPNMFEVIRELVPYVGILKVGDENRIRMSDFRFEPGKGGRVKYNYAKQPLYLIDGKPLFDNEVLLKIDPTEVERIEVINRGNAFAFGSFGNYGVMSVITKHGKYELPDSIPGILRLQLAGYNLAREFYSPVLPTDLSTPDFRDVIYWNPKVELDEEGEAVVEFYLGDDITTATIEVEGITMQGKTLRQSEHFNISIRD